MNPDEVDRHYFWQFKALLGLDQPADPTASPTGGNRELTRAQMAARSQRLRNLDPDVAAERVARARSRNRRRERQRADPEWREEVKRNREREKVPDPSRVVQTGSGESDVVIVR